MAKTRSGYKKVKSLFGKYEDIPEEWEIQLVSKTQEIMMGQSPPSESYNQEKQGLPFYQGVTDFGDMYPNPSVWCTDPKKITGRDTILFSVRAPVGEVNITKTQCCLGRGIAALNPTTNDLMYCYYIINQNKKRFLIYAQGTTYDAINQKDIASVKLPHTKNILEQQKIASILSGVDALIESTQKTVEKTERLKKGLMQQLLTKGISQKKLKMIKSLFGRYEEIPKEWTVKKINDFATVRGRIGWKNLRADEYMESGPLMLSVWSLIGNILYGIDYNVGIKRLSKFRYDESPEIQLKDEDVLVAKDGDIGRIGFVKKLPEHSTVNSHVVIVRIKNKQMHPEYLYHYMKFHPFQAYCKSYTSGTTVPLFTQKDLRNALIISPQIDEQQKIASILSGVDAYIQKNQQYKERLEKLKKGLMQKLLTGQIRVKV